MIHPIFSTFMLIFGLALGLFILGSVLLGATSLLDKRR